MRGSEEATETTPILAPSTPSTINTQQGETGGEKKAAEDGGETGGETGGEEAKPSFSFRSLDRREKLTIFMMALINFCACACFGVLAPFFPQEANQKGASQSVVGFIFSTFELVIFISSPIYGTFLGTIGPNFMLTAGIMTCGTTAILFGLLDQSPGGWVFILLCFLIRSVEALGCSAFITASFAIIANTFPSHVATVMGILETFSGIGMMAGPAIGGVLFQLGGYGLPFWVLGGVLILCGVSSAIFLPTQCEAPEKRKGSVLTLLRSLRSWVTVFVVTACSFGLGFLDPTLAKHLDTYKLLPSYVGLVFLIAPGIYGFTAPLWGWIADAKGQVLTFMVGGTLAAALSYLTLGPSPLLASFLSGRQLWVDCTSLAVLGVALGCAFIPTFPSFIVAAQDLGMQDNIDTYGLVSGLFNSGFSLGAFLGPTFGGILQEHFGFAWAATVSCGILLLSSLVTTLYGLLHRSCCRGSRQAAGRYEVIPGSDSPSSGEVAA